MSFPALFADNNTGSGDELMLRLAPGKVHSALEEATLNPALTSGDCAAAGNADSVLFGNAGGLCTSSESHLTEPPSLLSLVEPAQQIAPYAARWETQRRGDSPSYYGRAGCRSEPMSRSLWPPPFILNSELCSRCGFLRVNLPGLTSS